MESVECHTCHARWSTGEWGMHVIREENLDLDRWKEWSFSDPTLQNMLWNKNQVNTGMIDWLSARWEGDKIIASTVPGIFLNLFAETDWNTMILGKNQRGKYSIMKPRYQYFLTDPNRDDDSPAKSIQVPVTKDGGPGLILLPHTPHTIRKIVRPCESCHDNKIALGLGDPKRKTIVNSESFLANLKNNGAVSFDFQAKQVVTEAGEPIQTTYPNNQARFLNAEEITAIKNKSDAYKAFRYMDLKTRRFPRLLVREEFPFDSLHIKNEELAGEPKQGKDIFFNKNQNNMKVRKYGEVPSSTKKLPDPALVPADSQENFSKQGQVFNKKPKENDVLMEFSPDLFEVPVPGEEFNSDKNISINESELNEKGF